MLFVALRLGLTSFGGPVAHLGYFHNEYVERRRWLSEETYAEVVALSQALPGPASNQTGIAIGLMRAGLPGAMMAWIGFTLPSALALVAASLLRTSCRLIWIGPEELPAAGAAAPGPSLSRT